jgi:C_GCAxxG_C_C family probable redox protein
VGEVCGAVTGGVLAIGLLYGQDHPDAVRLQTAEFVRGFAERKGAVRCIDLIGFDVSSAMTGDDISNVMGLLWFFVRGGKMVCNRAVSSAVEVLLEQWEEWRAWKRT